MESYWVLRVKGRNRWQETVYTGAPEYAFCRAAELAEQFRTEVTVFEAKPVRVVSIKDVSEKPPEAPALPKLDWPKGQTITCGEGMRVGLQYPGCGHWLDVRGWHGKEPPETCPQCSKEREEAVRLAWWQRSPWKDVVLWIRDRGAFYYRGCGHLVPMDQEEIPAQCPTCGSGGLKTHSAAAAGSGGTETQAKAEAGPGPGRG